MTHRELAAFLVSAIGEFNMRHRPIELATCYTPGVGTKSIRSVTMPPQAASTDKFGARATLKTSSGSVGYYRLSALQGSGTSAIERLPFTVRVLIENVLRN